MAKKLRIDPGFLAVICLLGWLDGSLCVCFLCSVLLHEMAHLLAAALCRVGVSAFVLRAGGGVIETENMDYRKEIVIAAAGPTASFLAAAVGQSVYGEFAAVSILLGAANLLPVFPLDGGRILRGLLLLILPMDVALKIGKVITFTVCGGLMLLACWGAAVWQCGLWPVFAALVILCRVGNAAMKP